MRETQAITAFGALAQATRVRIIRRLVKAGPIGMPAGAIAAAAKVSAPNASFHLKELEIAGLVSQRRESRSIIYAAEFNALGDLVQFLLADCCDGNPEICAPALKCVPKSKSKSKSRKTACAC